jgi:simple sugar transport system ATP-binding protein
MKSKVDAASADIIAGKIKVVDYMAANSCTPMSTEPQLGALSMTAHRQALRRRAGQPDVDLRVRAGTVHGIVGENGAGKSTLMSILYGFYHADSGEIEVEGQPCRIRNAHDAIALGIGMVHQHFMLVDTFSALDNVLLGAEPAGAAARARAVRASCKR